MFRRSLARVLLAIASSLPASSGAQPADIEATIARVKPSVVAVGTFERTRTPPFQFRGTGFAIADGTLVVTNAHVLPEKLDAARNERTVILIPASRTASSQLEMREFRAVAQDAAHDLALLKIEGRPLPALALGDSSTVREGRSVHFTGFPIGAVLGTYPATHRAIVAAITPIAIPQRTAAELDSANVRRLETGPFPVFQLDGTAYPGNSGSPLFDASGAVIGVVNMVLVRASKESLLPQPSGISYAIPAEHVGALLRGLR